MLVNRKNRTVAPPPWKQPPARRAAVLQAVQQPVDERVDRVVIFDAPMASRLLGSLGGAISGGAIYRKASYVCEKLDARTAELEKAKHNKGGHRVAALKLVKQAIDEIHQGAQHAKEKKKEVADFQGIHSGFFKRV